MMNRGMMNPILYSNDTPQPVWAWIYHSPSLWLISLSSDWETRITIADKNLWATQVYNDWDELSQTNCWNYYQRGNNYWFPFDWSFEKYSTQVDASNYWPYYESDTFITWHNDRSSIVNNNLRWNFFDYSSINPRQWPCPEWFVIPSAAYIFYDSSGLENIDRFMRDQFWRWWRDLGEAYQRYLKIPLAWALDTITWTKIPNTGWFWGCYWSLWTRTDKANYISLESGTEVSWYKSLWLNIRPVKQNPVIPDETRTILYQDSPAGLNFKISHNPELWLITIWDGQYRPQYITIADKNLWATQVYNYWDELTQANCGNFYQRWNNYWFPFTWPTKTSTTQVDATNYWPYYNRWVFVTTNSSTADWSSVHNNNLWWWETDTLTAMKWPCAEWYHVPSIWEWSSMWSIATGLWISNEWRNLRIYLKMPFMSSTTSSWIVPYIKDRWFYRSSTAWNREWQSYRLWSYDDWVSFDQRVYRSIWNPIRPFKNESVTPDGTRIKLY